jgi:hypothetical protein
VFGSCLLERDNVQDDGSRFDDHMTSHVNGLIATGDYPQLFALAEEHGLDEAWQIVASHLRDPERFSRNLARLLDGIQDDLHRRFGADV